MSSCLAFAFADYTGEHGECVSPVVHKVGIGIGAVIQQHQGDINGPYVRARQPGVSQIEQRLHVEGAAAASRGRRVGSEPPSNLVQVTCCHRGIEVVGPDLWPASMDASGRGGIAAPGDGAKDDFHALCVRSSRQPHVFQSLTKGGPAWLPILAREGKLHVTQSRRRDCRAAGCQQARLRLCIAGTNSLQPSLGFFFEGVEIRIGAELTAHGIPSFRNAWRPLKQAGRRTSKGSDPSSGRELAPLPRTGGAPQRAAIMIGHPGAGCQLPGGRRRISQCHVRSVPRAACCEFSLSSPA